MRVLYSEHHILNGVIVQSFQGYVSEVLHVVQEKSLIIYLFIPTLKISLIFYFLPNSQKSLKKKDQL